MLIYFCQRNYSDLRYLCYYRNFCKDRLLKYHDKNLTNGLFLKNDRNLVYEACTNYTLANLDIRILIK
jgi:hypothetical protein